MGFICYVLNDSAVLLLLREQLDLHNAKYEHFDVTSNDVSALH